MPAEGGLRGPGWGKEGLLVAVGERGSLTSAIRSFLVAWEGSEATATFDGLMHEVRAWRARDPLFEEQLTPLLKAPAPNSQDTIDDEDALWRDRFISFYRNGPAKLNRRKAAEAAGLSWTTIRNKMRDGTPSFDRRLADMVDEVEDDLREESRADIDLGMATLRDLAVTPGRDQAKAADALVRQGLSIQERLDGKKWGRNENHKVVVSATMSLEAKRALVFKATTLTTLQSGETPQLPPAEEEDIVEGEEVG